MDWGGVAFSAEAAASLEFIFRCDHVGHSLIVLVGQTGCSSPGTIRTKIIDRGANPEFSHYQV
jgi:hypothetical protein